MSIFKTSREIQLVSKNAFVESIKEGVNNGIFDLDI